MLKQSRKIKLLVIINLFFGNHQISAGQKDLSFDAIFHAQTAIEWGIFGIVRDRDKLLLLPKFGNFYIESPYNGEAGDSENAFFMKNRDTALAERIKIPLENPSFWRGIFQIDQKLFLIDSFRRRFITYDIRDKIWGEKKDLVIDLIRPSSDDRGKPTDREVAIYRQQFMKSFNDQKGNPEIFSDFELIPDEWQKNYENGNILAISRIPGFPLLVLRCQTEGHGYCQIDRGCDVTSKNPPITDDLAGIAISQKRKLVLIGNYKKHQIELFQLNSCYHSKKIGSIRLPAKIKPLTSIHIDQEDNLWVTTESPDPYLNASVYRWSAKDW